MRQAAQGEARTIDISVLSKSDERVDLQVNAMPIVVGRRIVGVFGIAKDVTVRKRIEEALEYQALHDGLTDLPNRTLLYDRLDVAIQQARRDFENVTLLLIDLDRFKSVNDTLGHQAGDELLQEIAARLRKALRASDTVARLGGDEFAIVLPRTDAEGGAVVAGALLREIGQPVDLDGGTVTVGASIGLAVSLEDAGDTEGLLRCADIAMFAAKRAGGCRRYDAELREDSGDRPALVSDLVRAIEQDELTLHYQPKVSLHTGRLVRVEALVRWQHPERGFLAPDRFIPLAESSGQIDALSQWVLNAALGQCHAWRAAGLDLPVSVNLAVRNLHDVGLPDKIASLLERWSLPPEALLLEITEHGLMASEAQCVDVLGRLRSMGICIAIDDFGVGNAALAYLRRLPVDFLKIDKSFVMEMLRNERDDAIVRSTIELAHSLGLAVVAEGVEDVETLHRLKTLGCDLAQGYYMARPLSPSGLAEWLQTSEWASDDNLSKAS